MSAVIDENPPAAAAAKKKRSRRQLIEWGVVIVAALLTAMVLRLAVVQAFSIPSISMERTLLVGDRVLVNKLNKKVHHGDVIVFERPPGEEAAAIKDLIKRVIALPGETVSTKDGKLYVNDKQLSEPYLQPGTQTVMDHPVTVPKGHVWVMGDNRTQSRDSRFFGPINQSLIVGHAFIRVWPPNRFGGI
ncbi:MAG: signal peptidase I [Actinobacteria bacterium]|nr:signal peptidase I [Actinomycetota bacterium]